MVVIVFRSYLNAETGGDYSQMADEMLATAQGMPGFVEYKFFQAEDGERLSLVYWQDHETMAAWRNHPRHRIAQQNGRAKWYANYRIEIADIVRQNSFERAESGTAA